LVYDNQIPRMPVRKQNSNKGTFGKVLNFAGSENYIGAAYLSSLGVLKIGAGYVALATTQNIINIVSELLPEAVFYKRNYGLKKIKDFSVILIGCGFGASNVSLFRKVVDQAKNYNLPLVIDADGLTLLSKLNTKLPQNTILTPHVKEAASLLNTTIDGIIDDIEASAKKISEKFACVVALKSHRTVVCYGDNIYINQYGNSALAKAGTGDVLAGIISGLLAQKVETYEATKLGVYLHSIAGEYASKELTEYSVLASDIPKYLSCAIKNHS